MVDHHVPLDLGFVVYSVHSFLSEYQFKCSPRTGPLRHMFFTVYVLLVKSKLGWHIQ